MKTLTTLLLLLLPVPGAPGPLEPTPLEAPGGFVFTPPPDSVTVTRGKVLVQTIAKHSWVKLDETNVLVTWADPEIPKLPPGTYDYWVRGHWGQRTAGPFKNKPKPLPEAVLTITSTKICLERSGATRKCM